jgi:hypothetical protein
MWSQTINLRIGARVADLLISLVKMPDMVVKRFTIVDGECDGQD